MLRRIEIKNYRCLKDCSVELGNFHMLVGPNGSGKSSFLDALAFIRDVIYSGPTNAIRGDGNKIPPRVTDPSFLTWMRQFGQIHFRLELDLPEELAITKQRKINNYTSAAYELHLNIPTGPGAVQIAQEQLSILKTKSDNASPLNERIVLQREGGIYLESVFSTMSALFEAGVNGNDEQSELILWVRKYITQQIHKLTLNAEKLRLPSPPGSPTEYATDGSNLPWIIEHLRNNHPERFEYWIGHLQTAIPELKDIRTIEREEDRHRYIMVKYDNDLEVPSYVISDGTLRLLALTLLAYVPDISGVYLIEEPENGIHPRAVETLFQSLSSVYGAQLLCASHSPVVLNLTEPEQALCFTNKTSGATKIIRGDQHPQLMQLRHEFDLGTLLATGILE